MVYFIKALRISIYNLKKTISSIRVLTVLLIVAGFILQNLEAVLNFSNLVGVRITPYAFPHLTNDYICQLVIMAGVIFIFSNAPYEDDGYFYMLSRSGKLSWALGQIFYSISISLIYILFLLLVSVLPLVGNMDIGCEWGKIWGTLAKTDAGIQVEKQGAYSIVTGIKADGSTGKINLPEKIHDIDISAGYIPEGMEWIDEFHLEYPEHDRTGGFSFASVLLDEDDLSKVMQDKNVVDCEERTFGNYEGVYLKYNDLAEDGSFNQRIYLLRPDVYRVITVYIGDDVSKEDAIKVVENLVITENDTMIETAGLYTWSEMVSPEESSGEAVMTSIADNKLLMHQIGEVFDISASGEDRDGNYIENDKISVCVDAVQVEDNLQLLGQNNVPEEWTDAVGTDGNLVNNTLSYIKSGNGIDSVDEIVKTESVKQKLVYATVTYTNKSDEEINHMLYIGTLLLMDHEDGAYQIYDPTEQSGDDYNRVIWDGVARTAEMTYNSISEDYGNGGNYISSLKPGESIQVNMA